MLRNVAKAAMRYLQLNYPGAEHLGHTDDFEVYKIEDDLVFIKITEDFGLTNVRKLQEEFEKNMFQWFENNDGIVDINVRCDVVAVKVIGKDRAIVRHHVNAIQGGICG